MRKARGPILGKTNGFAGGHLDNGEHLARHRDDGFIRGTANFESAPEPQPLDAFQSPVNDQPIPEFSRAFVVDLRPHDDGIVLRGGHFHEAHAELFREQRACHFDEPQVDDIVHHAGAIRIEKHHLDGRFNTRSLDGRRLGR